MSTLGPALSTSFVWPISFLAVTKLIVVPHFLETRMAYVHWSVIFQDVLIDCFWKISADHRIFLDYATTIILPVGKLRFQIFRKVDVVQGTHTRNHHNELDVSFSTKLALTFWTRSFFQMPDSLRPRRKLMICIPHKLALSMQSTRWLGF